MSWWSRMLGREQKASAAGPIISSGYVGQAVWTPRKYAALAREGYVQNAVAYRCIKLIATAAASAPWLLTGKGGAAIDEHPLLELLKRPGPMIGGASLFEAFYSYLLAEGNGYLEGVGPSDNAPPRELWAHRPDRMRAIVGPYGLPQGYEYEVNGQLKKWQVDPITGRGPILHVKEFHPLNDWYGMGRLEPAAYGIDRHNAASAHNKALLDNGARPSGALVFEPIKHTDGSMQSAPGTVIEKAEKDLKANHTGLNKGKPMVFGGLVKWIEMGLSPKDMDFGEGKDDAAWDICLAAGVPPILVVKGQATYNNITEAKLELWEETVLPLLDKAMDALDAWLCPMFGDGLHLSADLDAISALEPRREAKRKSTVELLDKGVIDADEAREALQFGPRKAEAVKKVEPQVVTALLAAAKAGTYEPLYRYLRAASMLEPDTTLESFQADLESGVIDEAALVAASTPDAVATPAAKPPPAGQGKAYNPNQPRASRGRPGAGRWISRLGEFLGAMERERHRHFTYEVGPVENSAAILAAGGPHTQGWHRLMESSEVRHALQEHGEGSPKWHAGSQLSKADLSKIERIVGATAPTLLSRKGGDRLTYRIELEGVTYTYAETISRKRQAVLFKTMWRKG